MHDSELTALNKAISNDARTLYLLGLRPTSNAITGLTEPLDYKALLALLNSKEQKFTRGRQINTLLKELVTVGLVHIENNNAILNSLNGKSVLLKQRIEVKNSKLLPEKVSMFREWQPNLNTLYDICALIGVIDPHFEDQELGEFIVYWLGRQETKLTEYQWAQKFAQQLKRQRTVITSHAVNKIGTQTQANTVSSLEADDNAKRLVAKYKKLKNNK